MCYLEIHVCNVYLQTVKVSLFHNESEDVYEIQVMISLIFIFLPVKLERVYFLG